MKLQLDPNGIPSEENKELHEKRKQANDQNSPKKRASVTGSMTTKDWVKSYLIVMIPIVGIIWLIAMAINDDREDRKQNFRALCFILPLLLLLYLLFFFLAGPMVFGHANTTANMGTVSAEAETVETNTDTSADTGETTSDTESDTTSDNSGSATLSNDGYSPVFMGQTYTNTLTGISYEAYYKDVNEVRHYALLGEDDSVLYIEDSNGSCVLKDGNGNTVSVDSTMQSELDFNFSTSLY